MLTSHDVGQRVSVRRRVEGGLTDVLGHLLDVTDDHLDVLRKDGAVLSLPTADVTAAKVVPPATPRRGWEVPAVSPDDMQRICWAGWPARETSASATGRCGPTTASPAGRTPRWPSATPAGRCREALRRVASWYAERGLPPLLQLPLADPANQVMADEGWRRLHVTVVQVAPIDRLLAGAAGPAGPARRSSSRCRRPTGWR